MLFRSRGGIAGAHMIGENTEPYAAVVFRSAQQAFVQGWQQAMWAGVVVMVLLLIYVLLRGPKPTQV